MFWIHTGSFALYNALIGYLLLHREEPGLWPLLIFFVAMALHFVTNDFGLREDHKERYDRRGRYLLAVAVIAGWAIGALTSVSETAIGFLFAFLAGGVVLNVLKEELPEERQSRARLFATCPKRCESGRAATGADAACGNFLRAGCGTRLAASTA